MTVLHTAGLLHSDILGSTLACRSPRLFAAYRVLLRLLMPRHPPCALISLNASLQNYVLFSKISLRRSLKLYFTQILKVLPSIGYSYISSLLFRYSIFKDLLFTFEHLKFSGDIWWAEMDSNHRPLGYQPSALTSWAISPYEPFLFFFSSLKIEQYI